MRLMPTPSVMVSCGFFSRFCSASYRQKPPTVSNATPPVGIPLAPVPGPPPPKFDKRDRHNGIQRCYRSEGGGGRHIDGHTKIEMCDPTWQVNMTPRVTLLYSPLPSGSTSWTCIDSRRAFRAHETPAIVPPVPSEERISVEIK